MSMKFSGFLVVGVTALVGLSGLTKDAVAADVNVSASVVTACTLTGADITFGAYVIGQTDDSDAQDNVSYDCGAGRNITLELNYGISGAPATKTRNLLGGSLGGFLPYNLYQDTGRNTVWGTGADGIDVTSTATGIVNVPVFGRINGGESADADTYSDTVTFSVTING